MKTTSASIFIGIFASSVTMTIYPAPCLEAIVLLIGMTGTLIHFYLK